MASDMPNVRSRSSRGLTDDDIFHILEESDIEPFADDSDEDPDFNPVPINRNIASDSSDDSQDENFDTNVPVPSPSLSDSSVVRHTVSRGHRRLRRVAGRAVSRSRGRNRARIQVVTREAARNSDVDGENNWTRDIFQPEISSLMQPAYLENNTSSWDWYTYFEQYVDDDILSTMVDCTNRTHILIKGKTLGLTTKELKTYLGIVMIMAALQYPQIDMYWSEKWRVPIIVQAMTRCRFYAIRTQLKCVFDQDVTEDQRTDKIWKIRPLFNRILRGCLEQVRPQAMCVDEMIIPFSGRCHMRQYCPNKPNPVGLKVFVLASPQGIVCDMIVYQGDTTFPDLVRQGFGLGEAAVLHLTESLVPGHILFFDRYFTTVKLCDELRRRGLHGTGTIMRNRIPKDCVLTEENELRKLPRGTSESKIRKDYKLAVTMWLDNKPVIMMSTCYADSNQDECERWSKQKKKYERVNRPEVIRLYNQNMGGVDLADRMLSVCPSRNRTRKWTIRVISHLFDLAVVNSWLQYRAAEAGKGKSQKKIEQLREYKLNLAIKLINDNTDSTDGESNDEVEELLPQHKKRKTLIIPLPSAENRQRKAAHLPAISQKQSRCRMISCSKKTKVYCEKCNIFLCLTAERNCYATFHK